MRACACVRIARIHLLVRSYLVKSVSEVSCHLYDTDTCIGIAVNDCGVQVVQVLRGRDDPDSICVMQWADTVMSFPCPDIAAERQRTVEALAVRLRDPEVVRFIQSHVERLVSVRRSRFADCRSLTYTPLLHDQALRLPNAKVCAMGLLSFGVLESLAAALAPRALAPLPRGVSADQLTTNAVLTFLSSPNW